MIDNENNYSKEPIFGSGKRRYFCFTEKFVRFELDVQIAADDDQKAIELAKELISRDWYAAQLPWKLSNDDLCAAEFGPFHIWDAEKRIASGVLDETEMERCLSLYPAEAVPVSIDIDGQLVRLTREHARHVVRVYPWPSE